MHVVGGHISQTGTKPATDLWSLGPGCTATWLVKTCLLLYLINSVYLTLHMFVSIGTLDWYVCRHCKWAPLPVGHLRHHCCAPICPLCCLLRPVQGTWELMCCQCTDSCWKCQKLKKNALFLADMAHPSLCHHCLESRGVRNASYPCSNL